MAKSLDFQAFPVQATFIVPEHAGTVSGAPGMTYAEWLYGQAVAGLASNPAGYDTDIIVKMALAIVHEMRAVLEKAPPA